MSTGLTDHCLPERLVTNAQFFSKAVHIIASCNGGSGSNDMFWTELLISGATLHRHVDDVISMCSEKQMVWIYAGSDIAPMTDLDAFGGERSMRQVPCHSVGAHHLLLKAKPAVSAAIKSSRPKPTRLSLTNLAPEQLHTENYNA